MPSPSRPLNPAIEQRPLQVLGFLSPSNRGGLMSALLLLFVLMGIVAGYCLRVTAISPISYSVSTHLKVICHLRKHHLDHAFYCMFPNQVRIGRHVQRFQRHRMENDDAEDRAHVPRLGFLLLSRSPPTFFPTSTVASLTSSSSPRHCWCHLFHAKPVHLGREVIGSSAFHHVACAATYVVWYLGDA